MYKYIDSVNNIIRRIRMKKILLLLVVVFLLNGCGKNTARMATENYLKKYKTLNSEVLVDMENIIKKENLTTELEDKYREVLKKQYKDLSYEIIEEEYDDDVSYVTVKIDVYDLYKAERDADIYLENNKEEFYDENELYDINKFLNYKLDRMKETTSRIKYTIVFTITKENDKYVVEQPTENDLKKIHGIYNYEIEQSSSMNLTFIMYVKKMCKSIPNMTYRVRYIKSLKNLSDILKY